MRVDVITSFDEFRQLRPEWERIYNDDPNAQLFLSWSWLFGWLPKLGDPWIILAAKEERDGKVVAFWPLRVETRINDAGVLSNHIKMAGNHAADYTGIICVPAAENRAIAAFARHLKQMNWCHLRLENVREPELRLRQLLAHFPKSTFDIAEISLVNKDDGIDNGICTHADLPGSFDDYLAGLSTNTRQKLRRLLRLLESNEGHRVSVAGPDTIERDIEVLLEFWRMKWATRKGESSDGIIQRNRLILRRSFELGLLYLPVVWQGDRPLAALGIFTDADKRAFLFYIAGRDEEFDGPPMGMLLHAYSIRHAIAQGFVRYDFLRGNEPYKYSFGVTEGRHVRCLTIQTRTGRNLGLRVDPRTTENALGLATKLHQSGKLTEAERAYRQIIDGNPRHADALYRFGQLLTARGNHAEAKRVFAALTRIRPDAPKAWFCLAQSYEALRLFVEAGNAYRTVARLEPRFPDIDRKIAQSRMGTHGSVSAVEIAAS